MSRRRRRLQQASTTCERPKTETNVGIGSSTFRMRPRQQTERGSKQLKGPTGPSLRTRQCQNSNIPVRPLQMTTMIMWISLRPLGRADSVHRSSKGSFHGSLTGLDWGGCKTHSSPRAPGNKRRGFKTCATRTSLTSGSTTWTPAREVFSRPHDFITNVQKRLGNTTWTGFGQRRLCGSFLDPQLEHGETCSTAEATRGHYGCVHAVLSGLKLADPGTTEPRGLTETQSRPADLFTTAAVPDAARPWMCAWPLPTQQRLEGTPRRQLSIGN